MRRNPEERLPSCAHEWMRLAVVKLGVRRRRDAERTKE
ncbi:hypothetical protein EKH55_2145 [Sinorhizobium alkalisoli]|nr:hypothetical protein EKH55_2145 [Sinorhizobium alkalisoli]